MPVTPTYPGVYVEEIPSGVRTIAGVSTSVALFVGRTRRGRLNRPTLCLNYSDFLRDFSADASLSELPRAVKLFFDNGGQRCWILRVANNARAASAVLRSEAGAAVLRLTAKDAGLIGHTIRVAVTYDTPEPESTFNLEVFRWAPDPRGQLVKQDREMWANLSMDPSSARHAPTVVSQGSALVDAEREPAPPAEPPAPGTAFSQSGRPVSYPSGSADAFRTAWGNLLGRRASATSRFQLRIGAARANVNLSAIDVEAQPGANPGEAARSLGAAIERSLLTELPAGTRVQVTFPAGPAVGAGNATSLLRISSPDGDVAVSPAATDDGAVPLMLGSAQGGLEVSRYAAHRPAPTGIVFNPLGTPPGAPAGTPPNLIAFAGLPQDAVTRIAVDGDRIDVNLRTVPGPTPAPMFQDAIDASSTGHSDGIREKWGRIADAVNAWADGRPTFSWRAEVWGVRLALVPAGSSDAKVGTLASEPAANDIAGFFTRGARYDALGTAATGRPLLDPGGPGDDGGPPTPSDDQAAYAQVERDVDIFNLLVLPRDTGHQPAETQRRWGPASVFCQRRRAFLLMDAPDWPSVQAAIDPVTGVNGLRTGLVKDHAALFFPKVRTYDDGFEVPVGPAGAIAGLMARIDSTRGVWKAPAGTEADLRGIARLERNFSDRENGDLNPRAINTLRAFPTGTVNWGARTMDGDDSIGSEWKYVPVRRLALFLEESLYRGTSWVVFEPNDEPLWAQIRLNVGAFMNNLFRQGAFQGRTPRDAYFVKCDGETTTQNDRNLGIVNVVVGFAPLKPAEFVILRIQQMAGQVQV